MFWPRTNSPLVAGDEPAPDGVGALRSHPRAEALGQLDRHGALGRRRRRRRADWSRPTWRGRCVPETSAATPGLDPAGGQSADDWQTLLRRRVAPGRVLELRRLQRGGVNVLADGGSILPSASCRPTPLADIRPIGVDDDLPSADGLELMLRVFDRMGLALVPSLQVRRTAAGAGIAPPRRRSEDCRHRAGRPRRAHVARSARHRARPRAALQPARRPRAAGDARRGSRTRRALRSASVVCRRWPCSFPAAATRVLPDLEWGLDDATIAQFERETGIRLAATMGRIASPFGSELLSGEHADAWRAWRAARVTQFYQQLAELVRVPGGKRRLLLTTEESALDTGTGGAGSGPTSSPRRSSIGRCSTWASTGRRLQTDAGHRRPADAVRRVDGAAGGSGHRPGDQRRLRRAEKHRRPRRCSTIGRSDQLRVVRRPEPV